jgi:predicted nucleic-acid-binding protein
MKRPATLPDTNAILRYLLHDSEEQFVEANAFFENVRAGKTSCIISESVLVECQYILAKYYQVSRNAISGNLTTLLQYKGIANQDREVLLGALALFVETSLDPVDCLLAARSKVSGNPVLTFDKALNRVIRKSNQS